MFKKQIFIVFFSYLFCTLSVQATLEKQSAIFYGCKTETILDANSLQEIFTYVMKELGQQGSGSISINYTEAGYTLLQALQKGGYLNLTIENKENKAYLDWLIKQKSAVQKKSFLSMVKKAFTASSYTMQ
jgi:hypothetical protein